MTIDWWTLGLQTINVVVLVWLLARFLFRPVSRIIAERQAAAQSALDAAKAAQAEAEAARAQAKSEAAEQASARVAQLAQAQEAAKQESARLLTKAHNEVAALRAQTEAEIAKEREAAQTQMAREAGVLASDIAARLLSRLPESARIDGFVPGLVEAVRKLPEPTREALLAQGKLALRAARAPSAEETTRIEAQLSEALGGPVTVDLSVDEGLLAGLELDAATAVVRNHLRADLDRIKAEVTQDD